MKQRILLSGIGHWVLSARDAIEMLKAAYSCPQELGMLANDHLAIVLVTALCRPNRVFLDVGAHIGSIVARVARQDPSIKIVAIEAMPDKANGLQRAFPSIEVHACAAGNADGEATFYVDSKQSGYSSLGRRAISGHSSSIEIRVPIRKIDTLVRSREIDVVKIDVEGAELGVLQGAESLLSSCRPSIMFESGPAADDRLGFTRESIWDWLAERDYVVLVPNRVAHNDPGLSREGFLESHLYPRRTTNFFALPRERRVEIRDLARQILRIPA